MSHDEEVKGIDPKQSWCETQVLFLPRMEVTCQEILVSQEHVVQAFHPVAKNGVQHVRQTIWEHTATKGIFLLRK